MNTCLFTGEKLTSDTKVEHTILDSLGGRVTSRTVTSSDFNEQSARKVDLAAKKIYWPVLMNLAYLVPTHVQAAGLNVETPNHKFPCRINKLGQLEIRGTHVERDETGKVRAIYAQDKKTIELLSNHLGLALNKIDACEPNREEVTFAAMPTVNPLVEVCMLKCILLTFDHLLATDPDRFTRSADLEGCRNLVRDYVFERIPDDSDQIELANYSLGLQYEAEYRGRYEKILSKAKLESKLFSHQLIVSGNPDTATLDAVFIAFGEDPHAFRLSKSWNGPPQTFVMTNGILKNESASEVVKLQEAWTLGKPNNRKSFITYWGQENEPDMEFIANEIAEHRLAIVLKAIEYEQMHSDDGVIGQIARTTAESWNSSRSIALAIFDRMLVLFDLANRDLACHDRLIELIGDDLDNAGDDYLSGESDRPKLGWGYWLRVHRHCFKKLMREFGAPGRLYVQRIEIRRRGPIYLGDNRFRHLRRPRA